MRPAPHVLVARLDSAGDVLITGPAIRAVAAGAREVTLLCGPLGRAAADLLPGVTRIIEWRADWITADPGRLDGEHARLLIEQLHGHDIDEAVIFTSRHHSPLPLAVLLRMAGVEQVSGISADRSGSLLDHRLREADGHEVERALALAAAAGYELPAGEGTSLRVTLPPLPKASPLAEVEEPYVVVHPGASVPARAWSAQRMRELCELLAAAGVRVVVTGSKGEAELVDHVVNGRRDLVNLAGRLTFAELGHLIAAAAAIVVGNTGPAHLAAAVGTPVVSLFAPTVEPAHWGPWGVPVEMLGMLDIECAGCRATVCPVANHPCLESVEPPEVVAALRRLVLSTGRPLPSIARPLEAVS